jgi:hypothetical protein
MTMVRRWPQAPAITPLYLHYNSGRHVSTNGHDFAELLEDLLRAWPSRSRNW